MRSGWIGGNVIGMKVCRWTGMWVYGYTDGKWVDRRWRHIGTWVDDYVDVWTVSR